MLRLLSKLFKKLKIEVPSPSPSNLHFFFNQRSEVHASITNFVWGLQLEIKYSCYMRKKITGLNGFLFKFSKKFSKKSYIFGLKRSYKVILFKSLESLGTLIISCRFFTKFLCEMKLIYPRHPTSNKHICNAVIYLK